MCSIHSYRKPFIQEHSILLLWKVELLRSFGKTREEVDNQNKLSNLLEVLRVVSILFVIPLTKGVKINERSIEHLNVIEN